MDEGSCDSSVFIQAQEVLPGVGHLPHVQQFLRGPAVLRVQPSLPAALGAGQSAPHSWGLAQSAPALTAHAASRHLVLGLLPCSPWRWGRRRAGRAQEAAGQAASFCCAPRSDLLFLGSLQLEEARHALVVARSGIAHPTPSRMEPVAGAGGAAFFGSKDGESPGSVYEKVRAPSQPSPPSPNCPCRLRRCSSLGVSRAQGPC